MNRFKGFLAGLLTVLALVAMLVVWIMLPWFAVLGIAVAIGLWLFLTRGGRLAREATKIGIAGLPQRWGASLVIVVGIAGVVGVLVAMLAMGEGFKATLDKTGGTDSAILLRAGEKNAWLEVVLDEGRNRQIRRLLAALDIGVLRLLRVAIGTLQLGELPKGQWRLLTAGEVAALGGD